jgi:phenylacetate-CoA ligase
MPISRQWNRLRRRALLALLYRQTPEKLRERGLARLHAAVARAMQRSSAYRELYRDAGLAGEALPRGQELLARLPILEKADLFERFDLQELIASDVAMPDLAGILTSSGHGGVNFAFGLSTRRDKRLTPFDIDLGLEHAFATDQRSTLLVNCLPMGVVFDSDAVCVANVSVREDMACAILRQAGPQFEQCILVVDPLFAKRLLDYGEAIGMDWAGLHLKVIVGEEMFSEEFRSYLAEALSIPIDDPGGQDIRSSMGVGELGLNLFFETGETVTLRRALHRADRDAVLPAFFAYSPLRNLVEIVDPDESGFGDLVVTMLDAGAPIPMLRYRTGDRARALQPSDHAALEPAAREALAALPFPVVAIAGKAQRSADDWPVDRAKALLYRDGALARDLSGAFVVRREAGQLHWHVQRRPHGDRSEDELAAALKALVDDAHGDGSAARPRVTVWPYESFPWGMGLDHERKFRYRGDDV